MAELLDGVFRDVQRDVGVELTAYLYATYYNHRQIDFVTIQQVIIDAFDQTLKPAEISVDTWNDFLNTILIGTEAAINTRWYVPHFWDEDIHDEDEMMAEVMTIMRAVFTTAHRIQGDLMLREMEPSNLPHLD
jgi:hypothetical protein